MSGLRDKPPAGRRGSGTASFTLPPIHDTSGENRKLSATLDAKPVTVSDQSAKHRPSLSDSAVAVEEKKLSSGPSDAGKNETKDELEDQLTNDKLQRLQGIFEEADEDGGGGLDMEEFRKAMRQTMGGHITDRELNMLFMKVDTNCDGTVDWDEYLTYMLLECREKDVMNVEATEPFPRQARKVKADHRDSINRIHFLPTVAKGSNVDPQTGVVDDENGRYLALSTEGVLSFWTKDWHYQCSRRIEPTSPKGKSVWVTDLTCMPLSHVVVVSTTNRDIVFYDISSNRFDKLSRITALPECCMCMKFYTTSVRGTDSLLLWGDDKGGITALKFAVPFIKTQFNPRRFKNGRGRFPFEELVAGLVKNVEVVHLTDIHGDVIRHIDVSEHLGCFISCSKDPESAMFVGDIEQKAMNYYFKVKGGINAFEYSKKLNIIATGGYDAVVRVWNPYVPVNPIIILDGHKSPILRVHINSQREHIISIAENKEIRVHDLNSQTCIQTYYRKMVPDVGARPVTASFFHPRRQALAFATTQIVILEHRAEDREHRQLLSHNTPVTVVRYNPLFHQVVSATVDSQVCVWNIYTGEKVMQFVAHKLRNNGSIIYVEVTAMNFDPTFRRLFTAMRDGTVKVWNFNNGSCLRQLPLYDRGKEITSIVCPEARIITAGWNKRLTIYIDDAENDTTKWLGPSHQEDILCLALLPPNTIASASYDGVICLWSLDTCRLLMSTKVPPKNQMLLPMHTKWVQHRYSTSDSDVGIADDAIGAHSTSSGDITNDPISQEKQRAVEKMIFLSKRGIHPDTAVLFAACGDGYVRVWSIHHKGHMKGQFLAAHRPGEAVTSLAVTADNEWLVTGDSLGYIKVWDISIYCIHDVDASAVDPARELMWRKFPSHRMERSEMQQQLQNRRKAVILGCYGDIQLGGVRPPKMVNSLRGHMDGIASLDLAVVEGKILIVTGSRDCSTRLWTLHGESLGILGQPSLWSARKKPGTEELDVGFPTKMVDAFNITNRGCLLPPDIRRVASACTLRVLNGGRNPMWALAKNILMWFGRFSLLNKSEDSGLGISEGDKDHSQHDIEVNLDQRPCEKVTALGKSYKRSTKHRPMPKLESPLTSAATQFPAYHYLPFAEQDMDQILATASLDKDVMNDIQTRYHLPSLFHTKKSLAFRRIGWAVSMYGSGKPDKISKAPRKSFNGSSTKSGPIEQGPHKYAPRRLRTSIFRTDVAEKLPEEGKVNEGGKDKLGTITEK